MPSQQRNIACFVWLSASWIGWQFAFTFTKRQLLVREKQCVGKRIWRDNMNCLKEQSILWFAVGKVWTSRMKFWSKISSHLIPYTIPLLDLKKTQLSRYYKKHSISLSTCLYLCVYIYSSCMYVSLCAGVWVYVYASFHWYMYNIYIMYNSLSDFVYNVSYIQALCT